MFATIVLFPIIVRRLSVLDLFRLITLSYPILYLSTPYFVLFPESMRMAGVFALVVWKCTFANPAICKRGLDELMRGDTSVKFRPVSWLHGFGQSAWKSCRSTDENSGGFWDSTTEGQHGSHVED
ncbi:hypothetical protein DL95DRAFT_398777 [Leptodontidium sp. 2 PMI_412]|nr:hypothetical protein DL95DRAFT_398777 [Leptodontidium sp. 2 PMI_412]